jgi:hypothetical protein
MKEYYEALSRRFGDIGLVRHILALSHEQSPGLCPTLINL